MNEKVLAFVIDGKVERIMRFDEYSAAIFLSDPKIIDITDVQVTESWNYNPEVGFYIEMDGQEVVIPK
jgi:hypothetical protein